MHYMKKSNRNNDFLNVESDFTKVLIETLIPKLKMSDEEFDDDFDEARDVQLIFDLL